jgi:hypothetical protein
MAGVRSVRMFAECDLAAGRSTRKCRPVAPMFAGVRPIVRARYHILDVPCRHAAGSQRW